MTREEAIDLIRAAAAGHDGNWADLGAGAGTFTAALAHLLGPQHTVIAADRDPTALAKLRTLRDQMPQDAATIQVLAADLAEPTSLDTIAPGSLAGVLLGNVLHFFADPVPPLRTAAATVGPGGAVVVLEYEGARPNPWVPHPVSIKRLAELAHAAGLGAPDVVSETTSRYHGSLYCALLRAR